MLLTKNVKTESPLGYSADQKISAVLATRRFTVSAEIIPPRNGAEQGAIFHQIKELVSAGAHFLSVTKGAGGSLRGGSLPIAQAIKDRFNVPCIAHFTCRDLTPEEVENQLMDHHYFGIRNILALRGDPPREQPNWTPKAGSYTYAYQLIDQIRNLNSGKYLNRTGWSKSSDQDRTQFCIGAAVYPEHPDLNEQVSFLKKKINSGAEYGITQMIFSIEHLKKFICHCEKEKLFLPFLPGTRLLQSQEQAKRMEKIFQVSVDESLLKILPEKSPPHGTPISDFILEWYLRFSDKLRSLGLPGFHLFVMSDTAGCARLIQEILKTNSNLTGKDNDSF